MNFEKFRRTFAIGAVCLLAAGCTMPPSPTAEAYWQRVESHSQLYLTGPKAQQTLEIDISRCVTEINELVEVGALRETMPPSRNFAYHDALNKSGHLDYWDEPTRLGARKVDHSDYHDFETCMRSRGWERVQYMRYASAAKAGKTYNDTMDLRKYGATGSDAAMERKRQIEAVNDDYDSVNQ